VAGDGRLTGLDHDLDAFLAEVGLEGLADLIQREAVGDEFFHRDADARRAPTTEKRKLPGIISNPHPQIPDTPNQPLRSAAAASHRPGSILALCSESLACVRKRLVHELLAADHRAVREIANTAAQRLP
jgi:hypothetical protein